MPHKPQFRLSWASSLLLKPLHLTKSFDTFCGCQGLYFGNIDSFLSISATGTWALIYFMVNFEEFYVLVLFKNLLVKISQNLLLDFWHKTFWEPRTFPGTQFCPGLRKYYILAPSVSNFSPVNALFLSILIILPVRLIMWEMLLPLLLSHLGLFLVACTRLYDPLCPSH